MTPEEIAALVAQSVAAAMTAHTKAATDRVAAEQATKDQVARDKASKEQTDRDKTDRDKADAEKHKNAGLTPEANSIIQEMRIKQEASDKKLKEFSDKTAAAEKAAETAERQNLINRALGDFTFSTPAARQTAVEKVDQQVKRTESGAFIAGENLTVESFVKSFIPGEHGYLLAPVAPGSGLTVGQRQQGQKAVQLADLTPTSTAEQRQAYGAAIARALQQ